MPIPKNYGKVIHLALNFLLVILSFSSCASITRKYLKDQGFVMVGNVSLGITYVFLAVSSPVTSLLSSKFDCRVIVKYGAVTYFLFIVTLILPTLKDLYPDSTSFVFSNTFITVAILTTSTIRGFGGAMFWVGGLAYLRNCSTD